MSKAGWRHLHSFTVFVWGNFWCCTTPVSSLRKFLVLASCSCVPACVAWLISSKQHQASSLSLYACPLHSPLHVSSCSIAAHPCHLTHMRRYTPCPSVSPCPSLILSSPCFLTLLLAFISFTSLFPLFCSDSHDKKDSSSLKFLHFICGMLSLVAKICWL